MSTTQSITGGCEQLRNRLQELQRELPELLNQADLDISPDLATHYNQVMYHLQSAREELWSIQKKSKP